jgi:hypothetical protein
MIKVYVNGTELEIPDLLVDKYVDEFEGLPGGKNYESVCVLRDLIENIIDMVYDDPDIIKEPEYQDDFIRAIAMQEAMKQHGIYYDA